ncbi:DUF1651 domain-containing protein [Synechococcus sp. MIT S1220]|uniref:DUF1651 domain-containing protein n=1 Tax=Synechococcus sp. MIT S1220 TaxID=3082549 RepID=UPI0039B0E26A
MLFLDYGKEMTDGQPALLKSRRHLRKPEAVELWKSMKRSDWRPCQPFLRAHTEV